LPVGWLVARSVGLLGCHWFGFRCRLLFVVVIVIVSLAGFVVIAGFIGLLLVGWLVVVIIVCSVCRLARWSAGCRLSSLGSLSLVCSFARSSARFARFRSLLPARFVIAGWFACWLPSLLLLAARQFARCRRCCFRSSVARLVAVGLLVVIVWLVIVVGCLLVIGSFAVWLLRLLVGLVARLLVGFGCWLSLSLLWLSFAGCHSLGWFSFAIGLLRLVGCLSLFVASLVGFIARLVGFVIVCYWLLVCLSSGLFAWLSVRSVGFVGSVAVCLPVFVCQFVGLSLLVVGCWLLVVIVAGLVCRFRSSLVRLRLGRCSSLPVSGCQLSVAVGSLLLAVCSSLSLPVARFIARLLCRLPFAGCSVTVGWFFACWLTCSSVAGWFHWLSLAGCCCCCFIAARRCSLVRFVVSVGSSLLGCSSFRLLLLLVCCCWLLGCWLACCFVAGWLLLLLLGCC
jgi:hypothetical protein